VIALENELFSNNAQICGLDAKLQQVSAQLVDQHWPTIEAIAKALWAKPWAAQSPSERRWSHQYREKSMAAEEVISLLDEFEISAVLTEA
jgi:hypothetical protein